MPVSRQIEAFKYSRLIETSCGKRVLEVNRSCGAGLFSNFTTLLWDLCSCRKFGYTVDRLSCGIGLECYKDVISDDPIAVLLECKPHDNSFSFYELPIVDHFDHHGSYKKLPYALLLPYLERFFRPSDVVEQRLSEIIKKYGISSLLSVAVCFRGTDKHIEVPRRSLQDYVSSLALLTINDTNSRILVQTDEYEARRTLMSMLGDRAFYLDYLPVVSTGSPAVHRHNFKNRIDFAISLLAVNLLLSRMSGLITHTGNMALWQHLYRGSSFNVIQL